MALDAPTITFAKSNLCLLTDVKLLFRFNAIVPLLEAIHLLIKFSQLRDVIVWFHSNSENLWKGHISNVLWQPILFRRWCVWKFPCLHQFYSWKHSISFRWITNLNIKTNHLAF
jgi:hypothetical protein